MSESGTSILRAAMISFRLSARPLEGATRVAEAVKVLGAVRADLRGRPVPVVVGAAVVLALGSAACAGSIKPPSVGTGLEAVSDARGLEDEDCSPVLICGDPLLIPISLDCSSSASELAGALLLALRLRAFSCIAKQRKRCCSGSSITGGAARADEGGLAGGAGRTGLEERAGATGSGRLLNLPALSCET